MIPDTFEDLARGDILPRLNGGDGFEVVVWRVGGYGGPYMKTCIVDTLGEAQDLSAEIRNNNND